MSVTLDKAARDVLNAWDHYGTAECLRGWIDIMRAALAAAPQPQGEPVAWRVRGYAQFKKGAPGPWRYFDGAEEPTVSIPECCDIEPVYAHPPAPAAQPSAEPALVQAARDALAAMIDGMTPVEDGRPHHMVMEYKRALDALRRALDAGDGAGPTDTQRLDFIAQHARSDPKMNGQHVWWPTNFNHALRGPTLRDAIDNAMGDAPEAKGGGR